MVLGGPGGTAGSVHVALSQIPSSHSFGCPMILEQTDPDSSSATHTSNFFGHGVGDVVGGVVGLGVGVHVSHCSVTGMGEGPHGHVMKALQTGHPAGVWTQVSVGNPAFWQSTAVSHTMAGLLEHLFLSSPSEPSQHRQVW